MREVSNNCNRRDRGPSRTTWPPPWLQVTPPEEDFEGFSEPSDRAPDPPRSEVSPPADSAASAFVVPPAAKAGRALYALLSSGYAVKVFTTDRIPPGATHWCLEGDDEWTPIGREAAREGN